MILRLTRGAAATNGLIAVTTDQTSTPYYGLHKPNQLEQLQLLLNSDNEIIVTLVLGQYSFSVPQVDLFIEGVQQNVATIDEIKDAFSLLFLDSSAGGGGGGTINPTDTYLPYRLNAGAFADSSIRQSIAPVANDFKIDAGKQEASFLMHNDNTTPIKRIKIGNAQPVTSPFNQMYIDMLFLDKYMRIIAELIEIGDTATSAACIRTEQLAGSVTIGDITSFANSSKIVVNDAAKLVEVIAGDRVNIGDMNAAQEYSRFFIDNTLGAPIIELSCGLDEGLKIRMEKAGSLLKLGDVDNHNNGSTIVIDDSAQQVRVGGKTRIDSAGDFMVKDMPVYANRTAALSGGLVTDNVYQLPIAGDNKFLCIV